MLNKDEILNKNTQFHKLDMNDYGYIDLKIVESLLQSEHELNKVET